jgi:hypothetical protein
MPLTRVEIRRMSCYHSSRAGKVRVWGEPMSSGNEEQISGTIWKHLKFRKEAGTHLETIAEEIGVSPGALWNLYEQRRIHKRAKELSLQDIDKLCEYLGLKLVPKRPSPSEAL